jgi:hypothetical protein
MALVTEVGMAMAATVAMAEEAVMVGAILAVFPPILQDKLRMLREGRK